MFEHETCIHSLVVRNCPICKYKVDRLHRRYPIISPTTSFLGSSFARLRSEYPIARMQEFGQHPLGEFVRHRLAANLRRHAGERYKVEASVGKGQWAETPWAAVFDPDVTESAQEGYYVVYLFDSSGRHFYLSLNQATTQVRREFGKRYMQVLADRAELAVERLHEFDLADLVTGTLDLQGEGGLTQGYRAGNIVAIKYEDVQSDAKLVADLQRILSVYATYKRVRGGEIAEPEDLPRDVMPAIEAKKFRWHRRAERNRRLAEDAKAFHGTRCMICGFDYEKRYGSRGKGYIEAHHVVPFAELQGEIEPVMLDPRTDFVVVCANCHRMLHRSSPPISPEELKQLLN